VTDAGDGDGDRVVELAAELEQDAQVVDVGLGDFGPGPRGSDE